MKIVASKFCLLILAISFWSMPSADLSAQEAWEERISIPLTDPGRPVMLKASLMSGGISVKGYEGKEVQVVARSQDPVQPGGWVEGSKGLRRLRGTSVGLTATEENNVIELTASMMKGPILLEVQVPRKASLKLKCMNEGDIRVEGVEGEIEANNLNGEVHLRSISGSAVAHSLNGAVVVSFNAITADKSMSFSSMNGNVDVTLPDSVKANIFMKADNGEVYTDFEIQLDNTSRQSVVEDKRSSGGRYRVRIEKGMTGTLNGGGAELKFTNFNGNIYIRKKSGAQ